MSGVLLLVPLAAVFVLVASSSAAALAAAARITAFARPGHRSSAVRAALVFAPALLASLGCLALAFPNLFAACHCAEHGLHHPHLCVSHPAFAQALVLPAACIVGAWLAVVAPRLFRLGREVFASMRWGRAVRRTPSERFDDVTFHLVDGIPESAVTVGALSPVILFDRALWGALSNDARRAVLHHEQAHVARRDGLTLLALRLCAALYPLPLGRSFLDGWRAAAEGACDRHAAAVLGDADAVAGALVAVERTRLEAPRAGGAIPVSALGVATGCDLETRVTALLQPGARATESTLGNDALAVAVVAAGASLLTLVWPGGAFHHAVETLLGLLVP